MGEKLFVDALVELVVEVNPVLLLLIGGFEFVFECGKEVFELRDSRLVGGNGFAGKGLFAVLRTCRHWANAGHACLLEGFGHRRYC